MLGLLCVFERSSKYIDLLSVSFMGDVQKPLAGISVKIPLVWPGIGNGGKPGSPHPSFQSLCLVKRRASLLQSDSCCMVGEQLPGEPLWAGGAEAVPGTGEVMAWLECEHRADIPARERLPLPEDSRASNILMVWVCMYTPTRCYRIAGANNPLPDNSPH